jgi:sugar lactone lactonase YvrE
MSDAMAKPEILTVAADRCELGESPVWDTRSNRLYWTDISHGTVHCIDTVGGARQRWEMREPVGSLGLCTSGRLVVALRSEVMLFDPRDGSRRAIASVAHAKPGMRFNDGKVGPDGAFWVGSMDASGDDDPSGTLYRITADGSTETITEGLRVSNGLAWDLSGKRMYHSDSRGPWIDILDFDPATGRASNRRRWRDLDEATGRPDGGACDIEGNYWSAGPSASRVNRFSSDGDLLDWVDLPTLRPTMPCFGGPGLATLYVTSLSSGISPGELSRFPLCGAVVSFHTATQGVPVSRFLD